MMEMSSNVKNVTNPAFSLEKKPRRIHQESSSFYVIYSCAYFKVQLTQNGMAITKFSLALF